MLLGWLESGGIKWMEGRGRYQPASRERAAERMQGV